MGGLFGGGGGSQNTVTAETPLSALNIQSSANGLPIPLLYGTNRVTPNLIGYYDFTAVPHTTTTSSGGGGKGGGGGGSTSTNITYTYTATFLLGLGEGPIAGVINSWIDKKQLDPNTLFSIFLGSTPQTPWAYLTSTHPTEAIGYQGLSYAAAAAYDLGTDTSLPNHNFEVMGKCILGGHYDADPRDIIVDLLTNPITGVINSPTLASTTQYSNYCKASGLLLSPCYDTQAAAASMLTELFQLTNSGVYFSEGVLKIVPYGDAEINGNGVLFTPYLTPVVNLGDDDFLGDAGADPVIIKRNAIAETVNTNSDAFNQVTIEFLNRAKSYQPEVVTAQDQVAIDLYGLRPMSTITAHQIADGNVADAVAQLVLQRAVYVRAQYEFKLGWQWCFLEPTDYVTLTDTALGLNLYPVRILSIEEDEFGTLSILAEDAPPGVFSHVVNPVPQTGGYSVNYNVAPGSIYSAVIFEPPFVLAAGSGLEIWAGVTGPAGSLLWGGCHVWVSYDGTTYKKMDTINAPARLGHLTAAIDNVSTTALAIQLDGMGGALLPASAADAAALNTLFYVGGANQEFMAHQGALLTGTNAYTLSGLIRGAYGSASGAHLINSPFIRIDAALAHSGSLDLTLIGSTISLKFQSFNIWGGGLEDISTLPVYSYTISGLQATGDLVSGLTVNSVPGSSVLSILSWTASPGADHYLIDQSADGITWQRTGETKDITWADSSLYGAATRYRVAAVRALAGTWSTSSFLNINYIGMWNALSSTPMWNAVSTTPMWS